MLSPGIPVPRCLARRCFNRGRQINVTLHGLPRSVCGGDTEGLQLFRLNHGIGEILWRPYSWLPAQGSVFPNIVETLPTLGQAIHTKPHPAINRRLTLR